MSKEDSDWESSAGQCPQSINSSFSRRFEEKIVQSLMTSSSRDLHGKIANNKSPVSRPIGRPKSLIALSGGPDSTALLLAMSKVANNLDISISACHVNHHLRGEASLEDERFCKELCHLLSVDLHIEYLDWQENATSNENISEERLRDMRYQKLLAAATLVDADLIMTGHTRDDQAETVLFRLLRGTSPAGLGGIPALRKLGSAHEGTEIWLMRPLLEASKADCLRYLAEHSISPRFDESNDNERYTRNFIRQSLSPLIEERFPGWSHRAAKLASLIEEDECYFREIAEKAKSNLDGDNKSADRRYEHIYWSREKLATLPGPIARRVLTLALVERKIEPGLERLDSIIKACKADEFAAISLCEDYELRLSADRKSLIWYSLEKQEDDERKKLFLQAQNTLIRVPPPGLTGKVVSEGEHESITNIIGWLDLALKVESLDAKSRESLSKSSYPPSDSSEALVDLSSLFAESENKKENKKPSELLLRARRPGDWLIPLGMNERVKLKKYLHTHQRKSLSIPEKNRNGAERIIYRTSRITPIVLACGDEVLWVPGLGLSERVKVRQLPTHRLIFLELSWDNANLA